MNDRLKTFLKIVVSVSLFSYVVYSAGPHKIWEVLVDARPEYLVPVVLLGVVNVCLSSKKLQVLLRAKGESLNFFRVFKFYYIGKFFNAFLPTTIGGDVIKAHKISEVSDRSEEAYSSVFMERYLGVIAVVTLATISSLLYFFGLPEIVLALVFFVYLPALGVSLLFVSRRPFVRKFEPIYRPILGLLKRFGLGKKLERLYDSVNEFKERRNSVFRALAISFVFHVILITNNFILSKSVGMEVPFHYFFVFIPISVILLFLPISIRGFGVRESLYVYFFTQVGAGSAQAFSMSFLYQIVGLISSGIGGVVYLITETSG